MRCQEFREILDSYLGDELLIETNHEVLKHLENCPACRQELAARRDLRARLRLAVRNAPETRIDSAFARRLEDNLRETVLHPTTFFEKFKPAGIFGNRAILAAAFGLLIMLFGGWFLLRSTAAPDNIALSNQPIETARPTESPIVQAVQIAWRELTAHAVGDHRNCALKYNLAEDPITLDEAATKYGKYNKDLDKAVFAPLKEIFGAKNAGKIDLLEAHSCVYEGRRFAHVVLKYRSRRVSVLITETDLPVENMKIAADQFDGEMRVASFCTAHHAIFVVSDLNEKDNTTIAEAILPSISRHIERVGA